VEVTTIRGYLGEMNMTIADFSKVVECEDKYLAKVLKGTVYPSRRLAKDIYNATQGIVKLATNPNTKTNKKQYEQKNEEQPKA
jgi:hypothetical protein